MLTCCGYPGLWLTEGGPMSGKVVNLGRVIRGRGLPGAGDKRMLLFVERGTGLPPNWRIFSHLLWTFEMDGYHDMYWHKDKVDQVPMNRHLPRGLTISLPLTSWPARDLCWLATQICKRVYWGISGWSLLRVRDPTDCPQGRWGNFGRSCLTYEIIRLTAGQNWGPSIVCLARAPSPMHERSPKFSIGINYAVLDNLFSIFFYYYFFTLDFGA